MNVSEANRVYVDIKNMIFEDNSMMSDDELKRT